MHFLKKKQGLYCSEFPPPHNAPGGRNDFNAFGKGFQKEEKGKDRKREKGKGNGKFNKFGFIILIWVISPRLLELGTV